MWLISKTGKLAPVSMQEQVGKVLSHAGIKHGIRHANLPSPFQYFKLQNLRKHQACINKRENKVTCTTTKHQKVGLYDS